MKNKPNFFFDNRGFPNWGGGGSAAWEFFPHNPVFFLTTFLNAHRQESLSDEDRQKFGFDIRGLHWPSYIKVYAQVLSSEK